MSYYTELSNTIEHLIQTGKGLLAADESISTIGKRFAAVGIENTADNRRDYRLLLATTPKLSEYIHGVILFEETFKQTNKQNQSIPDLFIKQGILPGIKVDQGLVDLPNSHGEKITQGLDGLEKRLLEYKALGARFAKWRNVYNINEFAPSITAIKSGSEVLARYAAICQSVGIVPIVEPEILMDGDHSVEHCAEAAEMILHELFNALFMHQVELETIVLKPSMVTCGKDYHPFNTAQEIADYTISVFRNTVPAAVPTINFLSGGQSPTQATENLNAMNHDENSPWILSFSYGRALQEPCLATWQGNKNQVQAAQNILLQRAKLNSLACYGEYDPALESGF